MAMRVTNKMILTNANTNINGTKITVDKRNTQMTTQKKINRPSEDPVVAVRSLRLQTALSKVDQYYEKNIPDAESWMETTETALENMEKMMKDMRQLSVYGSTGTLKAEDRQTILQQLTALQSQIYSEGNADYAGRTVFTGFRTNKTLTFLEDELNTDYNITEKLSANDMVEHRYFTGDVKLADLEGNLKNISDNNTTTMANPDDIQETDYFRLRFAYDDITKLDTIEITNPRASATATIDLSGVAPDATGAVTGTLADTVGTSGYAGRTVKVYDNEDDWLAASTATPPVKSVDDNEMVIIKSTGDIIFGKSLSTQLKSDGAEFSFNYDKAGFKSGEIRPEYYFDCVDQTDPANLISYQKYDAEGNTLYYDINYTVAANQEMGVNLEAVDVFNSNIIQDINDMLASVNSAINAHAKADKIGAMMKLERYADEESQKELSVWLEKAEKEATFFDDNLDKLFTTVLGNCDNYDDQINVAKTKLGCKMQQLQMVSDRMSEQQETVQELQSKNDNLDISDIILKYTAAYNAYQSSLTAAGKLGQQTLLNYI